MSDNTITDAEIAAAYEGFQLCKAEDGSVTERQQVYAALIQFLQYREQMAWKRAENRKIRRDVPTGGEA